MAGASTTTRYSLNVQIYHWLTVILVVGAWTLGIVGDDLPRGQIRHYGETIHVACGEAVLILLVLRLAFRFVTPAPVVETHFNSLATYAAKFVHFLLYVLLLAVPAAGILTLFHGGEPLTIFGIYDIASPWLKNRELKHYALEIHELFANLLLFLAGLHAVAALIHHYVLKDRALMRMLPAVWFKD